MTPRPSSVGTPRAAVKLPSLPPPVEPSVSFWPSSRPISRARAKSDAMAAVRSIGGRLNCPSTLIRVPGVTGFRAAKLALDRSRQRPGCSPGRRSGPRPGRGRRCCRAAVDHADIHRQFRHEVAIERLNPENLMGQLHDGAGPRLRRHAGVGRLALDLDREPAHSLPRGLEAAVGQRRLENQDIRALAGQTPRSRAAIRGCRSLHPRCRGRSAGGAVLRPSACNASSTLVEHRQAGLHVEDAGTEEPPVLSADRHPLQGADRPDGVEMSEHQRRGQSRSSRQSGRGRGCPPASQFLTTRPGHPDAFSRSASDAQPGASRDPLSRLGDSCSTRRFSSASIVLLARSRRWSRIG